MLSAGSCPSGRCPSLTLCRCSRRHCCVSCGPSSYFGGSLYPSLLCPVSALAFWCCEGYGGHRIWARWDEFTQRLDKSAYVNKVAFPSMTTLMQSLAFVANPHIQSFRWTAEPMASWGSSHEYSITGAEAARKPPAIPFEAARRPPAIPFTVKGCDTFHSEGCDTFYRKRCRIGSSCSFLPPSPSRLHAMTRKSKSSAVPT